MDTGIHGNKYIIFNKIYLHIFFANLFVQAV